MKPLVNISQEEKVEILNGITEILTALDLSVLITKNITEEKAIDVIGELMDMYDIESIVSEDIDEIPETEPFIPTAGNIVLGVPVTGKKADNSKDAILNSLVYIFDNVEEDFKLGVKRALVNEIQQKLLAVRGLVEYLYTRKD